MLKQLVLTGFTWNSLESLSIFDSVRFYIHNQFTWSQNGLYVQPQYQGGGKNGFGLDEFFQYCKDIQVNPRPCFNMLPTWLAQQWNGDPYAKPILRNADPLKPESYQLVANYYFNLAARYGSVRVDHSRLFVNTEVRWNMQNEVKSGLGLLKELECDNESLAWWRGDDSKFSPEEYAVFFSMCYDGHEGRYMNCGVKNADPNFILWMCGLSEMNTDHLDRIVAHLKLIRTNWNIIEHVHFHHYPNKGNDEGFMPKQWIEGCSPEQDNIEMRLNRMRVWRDNNLPNAQLAYTEFGYDTNPVGPSWQKCYTQKNQADWIIRMYLLGIKSGIDTLAVFNLSDEGNSDSGNLFASCGLMTNEFTKYKPKTAFNSIKKLIQELNGFEFIKDVSSGGNRILMFENDSMIKYFYWNPLVSKQIRVNKFRVYATATPKIHRVLKSQSHEKVNTESKEFL